LIHFVVLFLKNQMSEENELDPIQDEEIVNINYDRFDYNQLVEMKVDEYYIEQLYDDIMFDCISEILFFIKDYTESTRLPIAQKIDFIDIYDYLN